MCSSLDEVCVAPVSGEVFGHDRVEILVFRTPTGSTLTSLGSLLHRFEAYSKDSSRNVVNLAESLEGTSIGYFSSITTQNMIFSVTYCLELHVPISFDY